MAGLGYARGLSSVNNWDADLQRLGQNYYTVQQARQAREQKIAWMADKMKEGHANTPYTNSKLRSFYDGLNKEVSDFVINNPGFEQDLNKAKEFNSLTERYLNNDVISEDMLVKGEFDKLRAAVDKGDLSEAQAELEFNKYAAYINQNPDGSDGIQPYIYTNYKTLSIDDIIDDASDSLGTIVSDRQNKQGEWWRYKGVNAREVRAQSMSIMADPLKKEAVMKSFKRVQETKPGFYDNEYEYVDDLLKNSKDRSSMFLGDEMYGRSSGSGGDESNPYLYFNQEVITPLSRLRESQPDPTIPITMNARPGIEPFLPISQDGSGIFNPSGNRMGVAYSSFKIDLGNGTFSNFDVPGQVKMMGGPTEIMDWNGGQYAKCWIEFDESDDIKNKLSNKLYQNAILEIPDENRGGTTVNIGGSSPLIYGPPARKKYKAAVYTKIDLSAGNFFEKKFQSAKNMDAAASFNKEVFGDYIKDTSQSSKKMAPNMVNIDYE
jgi:hypothetical protein